jgi:hypothetical protein
MRLENCNYRDDNSLAMKHLLLTTIAAVVLVGCATTQHQEPAEGDRLFDTLKEIHKPPTRPIF